MTAPTLLLLTASTADPRPTRTARAVRDLVRAMRPDLRLEATVVDGPSPARMLARLAAAGVEEVVAVPLLLSDSPAGPFSLAAASADQPGVRVEVTDVLGARRGFLGVLDQRLRTALALARARELDGLVLAAPGYPGSVAKGARIKGLDAAAGVPGVLVFHAGTAKDGRDIVTNGGRVLTVVASGAGYEEAIAKAYDGVSKISFEGMQYRRDIGRKALTRN